MKGISIHRYMFFVIAHVIFTPITWPASPLGQVAEGPALRLQIVEGEGAVNNVKSRVGREPVVRVVDRNNKPVAGAAVTFLLPQTGASGSFVGGTSMLNVITNAQGLAAATGLQANGAAGAFHINVVASFQGHTATAAIAQSNAALASGVGGAGSAGGGAGAGSGVSMGVVAAVGAAIAGAVVAGIAMGGDDDKRGGGGVVTTPVLPVVPSPAPIGFTIGRPSIGPRR